MSNVQINPQKQEELGLNGIMRFICGGAKTTVQLFLQR